jgi:hypothetical protein
MAQRLSNSAIATLLVAITMLLFAITTLHSTRVAEKERAIGRILEGEDDLTPAVQYSLKALTSGMYPCYAKGGPSEVYLERGDVWKYGQTCNPTTRYSGRYLIENRLYMVTEFVGTKTECLIMEKEKIFSYPMLPEGLRTHLTRPPGNKIDN